MKRRGPKTDPCGMPDATGRYSESWHHQHIQTENDNSLIKLSIVEDMDPVLSSCNLASKSECGTVSNAFETSKNTTHTSYPWTRALCQSSTTLISADTVDRLDMKPTV